MHLTLVLAWLVASSTAAPQASAPPASPAPAATQAPVDLTLSSRMVQQYQTMKRFITRMADQMPADQYGFQPTPEVRTFGANIAHNAMANFGICSNLVGRRNPMAGQDLTKTLTTKADLVKASSDAFALCDEYFNTITDAAMASNYFSSFIMQDGQRVPARVPQTALVTSFLAHNNEMYGYMAVYLRLKGIVPPSSERTPVTTGGGRH